MDSFLRSLEPGMVGLDVGCGNGKYLSVRDDIYIVASDYSKELVKIASQHEPHSSLVADTLNLPHPCNMFDFAISIAVIHHFSTHERRIEAIRHILKKLRPSECKASNNNRPSRNFEPRTSIDQPPVDGSKIRRSPKDSNGGGEALLFVWALEQKNSRRGWDEGHEQDVLVPWVLKPKSQPSNSKGDPQNRVEQSETSSTMPTTFHRYYHLYRRNELEEDVLAAGGEVVKSGYDRDNWWCVARKRSPTTQGAG